MKELFATSGTERRSYNTRARNVEEIECSQNDQHRRDTHLERQADRWDNGELEEHDGAANDHDGQRVAYAPQRSDSARTQDRAFSADDGGYGHDVVRIRRVTHSEQEAREESNAEIQHGDRGRMSIHSTDPGQLIAWQEIHDPCPTHARRHDDRSRMLRHHDADA